MFMSDDILKNIKGLDTFTSELISDLLEKGEEKKQEQQDISFKESYLRNDFDNKS
tara:strand:+ start:593 stop:757 length:165 start_codon:yes stop_codon:yes gene_type:complete